IDERAAILGDDVALHRHNASLDVDLDDRAVTAAGPSSFAAVERGLDLKVGVHVGTKLARCRTPRDLAHRYGTVWVTAHPDVAIGDLEILSAGFHEMRREIEHLGLELPSAVQGHASGHGGRPAAAGQPERDDVGVTDDDADLLERHAELVGSDLGKGRLVALAVRHLPGEQHNHAVLLEPKAHGLHAHRAAR